MNQPKDTSVNKQRGGVSKAIGRRVSLSPGEARLVKALRRAGVTVHAKTTRYVRRQKTATALTIGARELALHVATIATQRNQLAIVGTIRRTAKQKNNPRLVMTMCRQYAKALRGRRGFSALRLYNLYYAVNRRMRKPRGKQ